MLYDQVTYRTTKIENVSAIAEIVGLNSTAAIAFDDRDAATRILAALTSKPGITAAAIYAASKLTEIESRSHYVRELHERH